MKVLLEAEDGWTIEMDTASQRSMWWTVFRWELHHSRWRVAFSHLWRLPWFDR